MGRPNTVDFELTTAWRRTFQWVYVKQVNASTRTLTEPPIVGDVLRVTGLYDKNGFSDLTGTQAIQGGTSEIMFYPGDNSKYYVDMTVTSYSEAENWIMCTTVIRHTYATPYQGKNQDVYPPGFAYEAGSAGELAANQPFSHVPWKAYFQGCCRADLPTLPAMGGNANKPYRLETTVDLTDRDNSPSSRTMPIITVPRWWTGEPGMAPHFYVIAKDQLHPSADAPLRVSGGVTNYPLPEAERAAPLMYSVATAADLGLAPGHYTPYSGLSVDSMGRAVFMAQQAGYYQVAVKVFSNGTKTVVDFMVRAVDAAAEMPVAAGPGLIENVHGWVGFKVGVPAMLNLVVTDPQHDRLVLNYVFSGLRVAASTAAGMGGLVYSPTELSHQGLPPGALLYSTAEGAVVDIQVSFDNPYVSHRPQHDAAVSKQNRDYVGAPDARRLWDLGYRPVNKTGGSGLNVDALADTLYKQAFNLNSGTGGASVYLWVLRAADQPAITEVEVSTSAAQEASLRGRGFVRVDRDLNEQSSSMREIHIWHKKGSGPAIVDVSLVDVAVEGQCCAAGSPEMANFADNDVGMACGNCTGGFSLVPANLNFGASMNKIFLYVKHSPVGMVSKQLSWVPQMPGHYAMCYSGQEADTPMRLSSTQRCIDMSIRDDMAPRFHPLGNLTTFMGKLLTFKIAFADIRHDHEMVTIRQAADGLTLEGARFVGSPTHSHMDVGGAGGMERETSVMVEWFPDAKYGGFSGHVCFVAQDGSEGPFRREDETVGCVSVSVDRCKWWVQTEDTLVQVAARFGTNWLQVWHFNPTILHPDNALPPGLVINTGHLYVAEPSDALSALAERFGTSVTHIRANNWDMGGMPDTGLRVGQPMCVVPSSCATAANVQRTVG